MVLGAIVERLTGVSYFDYVRERIFRPLDMKDTDSWAIDDVVSNLAVGYARFEDDPLGIGPRRPNWIFLQWKGSAAGGGYSTTADLLKFVRGLGEGRLVRRALRGYAPGAAREGRLVRLRVHGGGGSPASRLADTGAVVPARGSAPSWVGSPMGATPPSSWATTTCPVPRRFIASSWSFSRPSRPTARSG